MRFLQDRDASLAVLGLSAESRSERIEIRTSLDQ
jgi:hypothetical protein